MTLCRNAKLTIHPTYTVGNPSLLIQHFKIQRVGHLQQTDELISSFKSRWSRQPGFANNKTTQSNLNFSWNWSWLMYQTPQQTADVSAFGKKSSDHDLRIAWNKFQATGLSVRWGWVALNLAWPGLVLETQEPQLNRLSGSEGGRAETEEKESWGWPQ